MSEIDFESELAISFQANRAHLKRIALRILGNPERAEDIVQDAYLKIMQLQSAIQAKQPIAYLTQVVRNLAIDVKRRESLELTYFALEDEGQMVADTSPLPEMQLITEQSLRLLSAALKELPARTQRVFVMYRLEGLTQREIANLLGVSATLVNFMIKDALTQCRGALYPNT
ncbi:RNA polymerase factor sigma-70 [Deefgea rivuli]|uniref:RNA polymerase factor sigma-70 n=1 Tax=Deefgea rivuli TaxID=400948 RepID=UPI000565C00B|nr:RNA polymerase factor sigma-70 [Deefgea rivuli]